MALKPILIDLLFTSKYLRSRLHCINKSFMAVLKIFLQLVPKFEPVYFKVVFIITYSEYYII